MVRSLILSVKDRFTVAQIYEDGRFGATGSRAGCELAQEAAERVPDSHRK